ncbi:hypothetical protein [Kosakonia sp. MUSA4]|uniref:hypothetical protein n=1 Tax=Kosakonia sp. MUSA4 TaxID=2067958 RepID=UPI00159738AC|nr:hypothetical protein [Kosakonia sp. MUSA4]QJT83431.1 hypothetical protein C0557_26715 [Kosakonia sp. MUSA4]
MAESYLKMKAQSDRQMALALTKALREIQATNMSTIESLKLGTQRLINYGSCLIPDDYYRNTCRELMNEDRRLVLALAEIYNRNDVALDMVEIYFRKTLKKLGAQKSTNLAEFLKKELGDKAYEYAEKSSKLALSLTIAKLVISSGDFQESHIKMVNSLSSMYVNGAIIYSKAQIAAMAANKLKFQDATYYQDLYKENLEMLYFLIEPQMTKIIYQVESGGNNEEIIGDALYELLKR